MNKTKSEGKKIGFSIGDKIRSKRFGVYGKIIEIRDASYYVKGNLLGYGWSSGGFYDNKCDIEKEDAIAYET